MVLRRYGSTLAVLLLLAAVALVPACRREPLGSGPFEPINSTFDTGDEGWTVIGDANPIEWRETGGNPGGYVTAEDRAEGESWFFVAPPRYRGDMRGAYGRLLLFDLRQNRITENYREDDVVLVGGGVTLTYDTQSDPTTAWTFYRVELVETGWRNGETGNPATRQEMETVLRSLNELRIRGEFFLGDDRADLDNVVFGAPR